MLVTVNEALKPGELLREQAARAAAEARTQRLEAQYEVMCALAESQTLGEAAPRILRAIGDRLEWDLGTFWTWVPEAGHLRAAEVWHSDAVSSDELKRRSAQFTISPGEGPIGRVWASGEPYFSLDVGEEPDFRRGEKVTEAGLQSAYFLPVGRGPRMFGVIEFLSRGRRPPDEELLRTMATLGGQIGQFVERRQVESALRVSEAWLATTLRSIGDGVIATDARGRVTFMNPLAESLTGWKVDEAVGRPLLEVYAVSDEASRCALSDTLERVIAGGQGAAPWFQGSMLRAHAGHEIPIDGGVSMILTPQGEIGGVVVAFRDERARRKEEDRRRLLGRAGTLLSSSLDFATTLATLTRLAVPAICDWCVVDMVRPDGAFTRHAVAHVDPGKNDGAWEIERRWPTRLDAATGPPAVIRSGCSELIPEIPPEWLAALALDEEHHQALVSLGLRSYMCVPLQARGRMLGAITCASAESGRSFGADDLALLEELAAHASLAIDNARLYHEAERANQAKDEFLATVSHELRTPLTSVLGWAQLLRQGRIEGAAAAHAMESLERNARALSRLIEDLLDVSRIVSGKLRLERRPMDLVEAVVGATDAVMPAAEAKGVELAFDSGAQPGLVLGDPDRLQQVVWNLLSNAIKFTPRGGRVEVRIGRAGSQAEIDVRDNGRGITAEFLPFVFERFRQAEGTMNRAYGGLGLGLGIARHLVELHGGVIRAESAGEGRGASFAVRLPLLAVRDDGLGLRSGEPGGARLQPLDGKRVLLVDDHADARDLVALILERSGARVEAVDSAEAALRALAGRGVDAMISDLGMPGEDGFALIRRVRASTEPQVRGVVAIALSAYARAEDRAQAMLAGYQAHLAKPVESSRLVAELARMLDERPADPVT